MATVRPYKEKLGRPPKGIVCARCGETFYHKKTGKPKYCGNCGVVVYYERRRAYEKLRAARKRGKEVDYADKQVGGSKCPEGLSGEHANAGQGGQHAESAGVS